MWKTRNHRSGLICWATINQLVRGEHLPASFVDNALFTSEITLDKDVTLKYGGIIWEFGNDESLAWTEMPQVDQESIGVGQDEYE